MAPPSATPTAVRVEAHSEADPPVLELIDDIQGVCVEMTIDRPSHPTRCPTDAFQIPVDTAYEVAPTTLSTYHLNPVVVRDAAGHVHTKLANQEEMSLAQGTFTVEICSMGLKVYLRVNGALSVQTDADRGRMIDCTGAETVQLGLRSFHESPAATVTSTEHPRDIMRALSCLGSALKTTSCERSFPSLRGHPPLLERGKTFSAPSNLEHDSDTASICIEVPPTLKALYPIAPLAYYLNAVVQPGEAPRLITGNTIHALDGSDNDQTDPGGLETHVARLLTHVFTLDCITRTEGLYPFCLGERQTLEQRLANHGYDGIDFTALYEQPLAEQLQTYLTLPFEFVDDLAPRWPLTADIRPTPKYLPALPFVVADLGIIRCLPTGRPRAPQPTLPAIEEFCRHSNETTVSASSTRNTRAMSIERSESRSSEEPPTFPTDIYSPPVSDSIVQCWLDDGYPMQGTKPTLEAWQRRLDAHPTDTIDVAVISNSPEMRSESAVADLYGLRDRIAFDVTTYEDLSRAALRDIFAGDHDLVHYVGHVHTQGLQCADGWLDAKSLPTVNIRVFVLNGCRSHEQGRALVDAGASGGLCTFATVSNSLATQVGQTVARLLNIGFSLGGALDLISETSLTGQRYLIVGDPNLTITEAVGNTPIAVDIAPCSPARKDTTYRVSLHAYPSDNSPLGAAYVPHIGTNTTYYINSGHIADFTVSQEELDAYLQRGRFPVQIDGDLHWSTQLSLEDV